MNDTPDVTPSELHKLLEESSTLLDEFLRLEGVAESEFDRVTQNIRSVFVAQVISRVHGKISADQTAQQLVSKAKNQKEVAIAARSLLSDQEWNVLINDAGKQTFSDLFGLVGLRRAERIARRIVHEDYQ